MRCAPLGPRLNSYKRRQIIEDSASRGNRLAAFAFNGGLAQHNERAADSGCRKGGEGVGRLCSDFSYDLCGRSPRPSYETDEGLAGTDRTTCGADVGLVVRSGALGVACGLGIHAARPLTRSVHAWIRLRAPRGKGKPPGLSSGVRIFSRSTRRRSEAPGAGQRIRATTHVFSTSIAIETCS